MLSSPLPAHRYPRARAVAAPLLAAMALSLTGQPLARAAGGFDQNRVMQLCLAGFSAAMQAAGKRSPAGMDRFTCDCFVTQMQNGAGIDRARQECRTKAAERFTVP